LFLPLTIRQLLFYLLCAVLVLLFLFWNWKPAYTVLTFIVCGTYGLAILFRLCSVGLSVLRWLVGRPCEQQVAAAELQALDRAALPVYTILVPMYKETEVAGKIARAVTQLDYPIPKLDVKLLLEEDDA
jgi:hypothetical protein